MDTLRKSWSLIWRVLVLIILYYLASAVIIHELSHAAVLTFWGAEIKEIIISRTFGTVKVEWATDKVFTHVIHYTVALSGYYGGGILTGFIFGLVRKKDEFYYKIIKLILVESALYNLYSLQFILRSGVASDFSYFGNQAALHILLFIATIIAVWTWAIWPQKN